MLLCIFLHSTQIPIAATHLYPKERADWGECSPLSSSLGPDRALKQVRVILLLALTLLEERQMLIQVGEPETESLRLRGSCGFSTKPVAGPWLCAKSSGVVHIRSISVS